MSPYQKQGKVAKATKKYVKRVLDNSREDKYFDLNNTFAGGTAASDNTGSIVLLSGISAGTGFANRIGEQVNAKSLKVRMTAEPAYAGGGTTPVLTKLRCIIFMDTQIRTSTLPTVADVLEAVAYNSAINHVAVNARRFRILSDRIIHMVINNDSALNIFVKQWKLKSKINYTNTSTGTQRNNIYVLYLSDQATATAPAVNLYSRLTFEDA